MPSLSSPQPSLYSGASELLGKLVKGGAVRSKSRADADNEDLLSSSLSLIKAPKDLLSFSGALFLWIKTILALTTKCTQQHFYDHL